MEKNSSEKQQRFIEQPKVMKESGGIMDPIIVFAVLGGLILVLLFVGAPISPIRWIGRLCIKVVVGALLLFFVNSFGTSIDLHIPINLITSTVSGILGIPGLVALVIIKTFIVG